MAIRYRRGHARAGGDRPKTPLHWAASSDDADVAAALIDGGADLERKGGSIGTQRDNLIAWRQDHLHAT